MNGKKIIVVVIGIALISAVIYAIYYFTQSETNTGAGFNTQQHSINNVTADDLPALIDSYYEDMMSLIMTPQAPGGNTMYVEYPYDDWFERLSPDFYSGDRYEFDNVVQKRIDGIIDMKNPEYKIAGAVTKPGALIDAYIEVGGTDFLTAADELFNEFKEQYLEGIGS